VLRDKVAGGHAVNDRERVVLVEQLALGGCQLFGEPLNGGLGRQHELLCFGNVRLEQAVEKQRAVVHVRVGFVLCLWVNTENNDDTTTRSTDVPISFSSKRPSMRWHSGGRRKKRRTADARSCKRTSGADSVDTASIRCSSTYLRARGFLKTPPTKKTNKNHKHE
jgi:hypothetical protein